MADYIDPEDFSALTKQHADECERLYEQVKREAADLHRTCEELLSREAAQPFVEMSGLTCWEIDPVSGDYKKVSRRGHPHWEECLAWLSEVIRGDYGETWMENAAKYQAQLDDSDAANRAEYRMGDR